MFVASAFVSMLFEAFVVVVVVDSCVVLVCVGDDDYYFESCFFIFQLLILFSSYLISFFFLFSFFLGGSLPPDKLETTVPLVFTAAKRPRAFLMEIDPEVWFFELRFSYFFIFRFF